MVKVIVRSKKSKKQAIIGEGIVLEPTPSGQISIKATPRIRKVIADMKADPIAGGSTNTIFLEWLAKGNIATLLVQSVDIHMNDSTVFVPTIGGASLPVQGRSSDVLDVTITAKVYPKDR